MNRSNTRPFTNALKTFTERNKSHLKTALLSFAAAGGVMALVYFCIGVPFFGNSVLVLDLNGQYVYFFESLHDVIYGGGSMLWSWMRSLGGEYMGIYAYYLASPLSWLVALMPSAVITEALYVMILLKVGAAGGAMSWYLTKTYPTNRRNAVIFSVLYALCAWALMYGNNVMWLDALALFPLIIRGADLLIKGKNYLVYTLFLALAVLSNFYMGYMICLFLVLYFPYHHLVHSKDEDYNARGEKAHFPRSALRYLLFTLIACGISAVIILPTLYSLSFGKNTFTDPTYEFSFKLTFLDLIYKLLPGAIDTVRREGLPYLYCGVASLFGAVIFFTSEKFRLREKIGAGLLFITLALCFSVSVIDIWWHGGQEPNWLNYRYSYMFTFFLLVCAYRGFAHITKASVRFLAATPAVIFIFYVILQQHGYGKGYEYTDGVLPNAYSYELFYYFLGVLIVGGVFAAILFYKKNEAKRSGAIVLTAVILGEAFLMGVVHQVGLAMDVGYSSRADYAQFMARVAPAAKEIQSADRTFYRMDKTFHRQPADAMALSMRSLSSTTSTLNRRTLKLLGRAGYAAGSFWSTYEGGTPATDMLFGVKYILTENTLPDFYYERVYTNESKNVYGYRSPYALPLAYGVSEDALDFDASAYESPMDFTNALVTQLTGKEIKPYEKILFSLSTEGLKTGRTVSSRHRIYTPEEGGGTLTVTFTAAKEGLYCLQIPTDYPRECAFTVDGEERGTALGNDASGILTLGWFEAGSTHTAALHTEEKKIYIKENADLVWRLDLSALESAYETLSSCGLKIDEGFREDRLSGSVTTTEEAPYLFTTIPYDEGWIIKIDGRRVLPMLFEKETVDEKTGEKSTGLQPYADALIFLKTEPGEHRVELVYRPKSVTCGGLISLGSLLLLGAIVALDFIIFRARKKKRISCSRERTEAPSPLPTPEEPQTHSKDEETT